MAINAVIRFLQAARSMAKQGMKKEQILDFARREFGEVSKLLRKQIDDIFKTKPKTEKKGDVVPIKEGEGIMATDEATEIVKKRTDDIATGDVTGEVDKGLESLGTNMKKLREAVEELKKVSQDTTPGGIMKEIMKGQKVMAENYKTGNIRTAVRQFMQSEVKAGRLKPINDFDKEALKVYGQTTESDPINIFRRYYGEDALEAVDEIGDVFRQGESFKHYEELLRNSVDKKFLTPKTKGLGEYDAGVLTPKQENELKKQLLKEQDQKQMLEDWDPDREPSAHGGIIGNLHLNRTGFKIGSVPKSFKLAKKIRDSKEYKDFIEKLFLKASTMIRRGEGLFKDLTQSQKITQHDNLTKEAVNYQKTGELPEAVHQYFGINPEHVYVQKLIKMEEANVAALEKSREKVRNFKKLQEFDPSGRKPNADGGLIDILKI